MPITSNTYNHNYIIHKVTNVKNPHVPYISIFCIILYIVLVSVYAEIGTEIYNDRLNWIKNLFNMFGVYEKGNSLNRIPQIVTWVTVLPLVEGSFGTTFLLSCLFISFCIFYMDRGSSLNHKGLGGLCKADTVAWCCGSQNYSFFAGINYATWIYISKYKIITGLAVILYIGIIIGTVFYDQHYLNDELCFIFDWHVIWMLEGFIISSLLILHANKLEVPFLNTLTLGFNLTMSVFLFFAFMSISNDEVK